MKKFCLIIISISLGFSLTFAQTSSANKRSAKIAYNSAVEKIIAGNYLEAYGFLESSLGFDPNSLDAKLALAKVKIELDMEESALTDFKSLITDHPNNAECWFYNGYLSFTGRADSTVLESLNKSISLGYDDSYAWYYRGLARHLFSDFQGAIADYSKAIEINKSFSLAYHDRGTARRALGDLQGALYDYRQATEYNHDFPVAFNNMGSLKIILGDYEGAIQDYSVATTLDSLFAIAYNNRGAANFYLGNLPDAIADFDRSLDIQNNYLPALNNKASSLVKKDEYTEAIALFNDIIQATPQNGITYLNRGLTRELTGDLNGACADWQQALDLGVTQASGYLKECK